MDLLTIVALVVIIGGTFAIGYNIGFAKHVIQPEKHECPLCNGIGWIQPGMLERFRAQIRDE